MKKFEKQSTDQHRDFLDMDSEEEDYGPQKTPDVEEELPSEPEKPVFSMEQLNTLVQYVKNLIICADMKSAAWNIECSQTISNYFQDPKIIILIIYCENETLKATNVLPDEISSPTVYFLRFPWFVYTVDNFFSTIIFGSINHRVNYCTQKFIENVYTPIIWQNNWSQRVQNRIYTNLVGLLLSLTDYVYTRMNRITLYIPTENKITTNAGIVLKCDNIDGSTIYNSRNINRIEKIMRYWIKQIRYAIIYIHVRKNLRNVIDEYLHWKNIYTNLKNLLKIQLTNTYVQYIITTLSDICSPSIQPFKCLIWQIKSLINESKSNTTFLNLLMKHSKNLRVPNNIEDPLKQIIHLSLFIWLESPHYHTRNNMEELYQALSTQIIISCQEYIQLDLIFKGESKNAISMLKICIDCCESYKNIYKSLTVNILSRVNLSCLIWNVDDNKIFNLINVFIARCYDAIEICDAVLVFGRCNKMGQFGGTNGVKHEVYCKKIETIFSEALHDIYLISDVILNVFDNTWYERMNNFRCVMQILEGMTINLIHDIFQEVINVEEGIEIFYTLQRFKKWNNFQDILQKKLLLIYEIFNNELEYCYVNTTDIVSIRYPLVSFHDLDRVIKIFVKQKNLKWQYSMITNASDWMGECISTRYTAQRYKQVSNIIKQYQIINTK